MDELVLASVVDVPSVVPPVEEVESELEDDDGASSEVEVLGGCAVLDASALGVPVLDELPVGVSGASPGSEKQPVVARKAAASVILDVCGRDMRRTIDESTLCVRRG